MATRVAFFGATGGCANACLANTTTNGISEVALARSVDKLMEQLKKRDISADTIEKKLTIITGDVKDQRAVGEVLDFNGKGVDIIVSGIDPTICSDATNTILTVMSQRQLPQDPLLAVISANGVLDDAPQDYPLMLFPLCRCVLRGVFDHKQAMEAAVQKANPIGGYVVVRPNVLGDGPSKGLDSIRQGTTDNPVIGRSISRDDVGL